MTSQPAPAFPNPAPHPKAAATAVSQRDLVRWSLLVRPPRPDRKIA
jgi:hypothetical protein